jgi:hypothetical protein
MICYQCGTDQCIALYEWTGVESGLFLCRPCMYMVNKDYDPVSQSFKGSEHYNAYYNNGLKLNHGVIDEFNTK